MVGNLCGRKLARRSKSALIVALTVLLVQTLIVWNFSTLDTREEGANSSREKRDQVGGINKAYSQYPRSGLPKRHHQPPLGKAAVRHKQQPEGYHSRRPKEKVFLDSNNNENSVPKDFDTVVDSNSNLGARSQSQRLRPAGNTAKHKPDKALTQRGQRAVPNEVNEVNQQYPLPPQQLKPHRPHPTKPSLSPSIKTSNQHQRHHQPRKSVTAAPVLGQRREQHQCEISGKEAISALSRAKTRECRQQIAEVYCRHKERTLMPETIPRYCTLEGESHSECIPNGTLFPI
ncbi:unnamed protein product [Coregonus sp. 'balchen']|nr:unnamed protein product [Coregonus sp. 'balchen']